MKKIALGITAILFGIALCILAEIGHVSFLRNDFAQLVYVIITFCGFVISIWGFFEKDR